MSSSKGFLSILCILAIVFQITAKPVKHASSHKFHLHHQHHLHRESNPEIINQPTQVEERVPEMGLRSSGQSLKEPHTSKHILPIEHIDVDKMEEEG